MPSKQQYLLVVSGKAGFYKEHADLKASGYLLIKSKDKGSCNFLPKIFSALELHRKLRMVVILGKSSTKNQRGLSCEEFFLCLEAIGMLYPYDENGAKNPASRIPRHIADLRDNPYRSLAGFARKAGAFQKSKLPYTEFAWAQFFRSRISPEQLLSDPGAAPCKPPSFWPKTTRKPKPCPGKSPNMFCLAILRIAIGFPAQARELS